MKKFTIYLAAAALLAACSKDGETSNGLETSEIRFSVDTQAAAVRTRASYSPWSASTHASTLGVFGFGDGNVGNGIFSNQKVTYADGKWSYEPAHYWAECSSYTSTDFFGYMVEGDELPAATLTQSGSAYTLTVPVQLASPVLTSKAPLICHAPHHATVPGQTVALQMDQTLTGYSIVFVLGEDMGHLRSYDVTAVKIYGENLAVGGNVGRTYTLSNGAWTPGEITWQNVQRSSVAAGSAVELDESAEKWPFYTIPDADFHPTIQVTYDVYSDGGTKTDTRRTNTIILNSDNFSALAAGAIGTINTIRIKIVPNYLYVLSDDDAASGYLVVE